MYGLLPNQVLPRIGNSGFNGRSETRLTKLPGIDGYVVVEVDTGKIDLVQSSALALKHSLSKDDCLEIIRSGQSIDQFCLERAYVDVLAEKAKETEQITLKFTIGRQQIKNLPLQPITIRETDD